MMKRKVLISILFIFILLICSTIAIWTFISHKDNTISIPEENIINQNTIYDNTILNEVELETINAVPETKAEKEKKIPKQENTVVEQTTNKTTTSSNTDKTSNKTNTDKTTNKTNTNNKTTSSSSEVENTIPKKDTTNKNTNTNETTISPPVTQPIRCTNNNNHGMDTGNCGRWFNTKNEAIEYYEEKINYWGKLWENYEIEDSEYYKNCPTGYEIWSCMYCSKWTINFYYR